MRVVRVENFQPLRNTIGPNNQIQGGEKEIKNLSDNRSLHHSIPAAHIFSQFNADKRMISE